MIQQDCPDCLAASERMHHGFRSSCDGCKARAVARGPAFFHRNDSDDKARQYRELLARVRLSPAAVMRARDADWMTKGLDCGTCRE
jgi:hypothetical protein